jgi:ferric-dicitrate binding protein FerR (iron transport regulator)
MDNMSFFQNDNELLFQKLAAYYLNELSVEERREVESWMEANETNAKQYQAVQKLLQQDPESTGIIEVDIDKGWAALNAKIESSQSAAQGKVRRMAWYWAAAAVMAGLLLGGWWLFQSTGSSNAKWIAKTDFDTLQLADGTTIVAQGPVTIKYRTDFNKGNRDIQLQGNAFFKVHRDTTQPFHIAFEEGKVSVLGTQFYINQQVQGFEVKVTEGKVKTELVHQKGEAILTKGKMVSYNKASNQFTLQDFAETSMLKYHNETLRNITKDIFLATGVLIRVDRSLADMKLTVDFVQSRPEEMLQALELLTQGHLQKTGANEYLLTQNE